MKTTSYWKNYVMNFLDLSLDSTGRVGVWADCPLLAIACNPTIGHVIFEDFNSVDAATLAGYTATQASAGTFEIADGVGGVALADSGSTTVTQGINVQKIGECITPVADKDIWYETRVKVVDTYDKAELFIGLSETDTAIIDTSSNASENHIGWQCVTDDGVLLFSSEKATAGATKSSNTIAEDTWVTLGFHVHGVTSVDHYVNGVKQSTSHVTANVPIVDMTPTFVCQSGGTNDPILHIDYYMVVQIR